MQTNQDFIPLYKAGAAAALLAGLLFRRNFGAEVSLFTGFEAVPRFAEDWFIMLQTNPFAGLSFLGVFDLINYILVGLVFLALTAVFWERSKSTVLIALASGLVGITINLASNASLTMLALSRQYAVERSLEGRAALLSAGESLLASANPTGTSSVISLLLIALAGLLFAGLALRSGRRVTGTAGLLAGGFDLAFCLTFAFVPALHALWQAAGGLFWMLWHLLAAWMLWKQAGR